MYIVWEFHLEEYYERILSSHWGILVTNLKYSGQTEFFGKMYIF